MADRLAQIDPAANPFINIWYVDKFESYAEFVLNPPKAWTVSGKQARFVQEPDVAFEGWSLNPIWRPFLDSRSIGDDGEIEKNV